MSFAAYNLWPFFGSFVREQIIRKSGQHPGSIIDRFFGFRSLQRIGDTVMERILFSSRSEEAIGTAHDLWTAYREGAFGDDTPRPFVGWVMLL